MASRRDNSQTAVTARYHCRACGRLLAADSKSLFHPTCLRSDKRRRTAMKRQAERQRFEQWLDRQKCRRCGATLGLKARGPRPTVRPGREASRPATPTPAADGRVTVLDGPTAAGIAASKAEMDYEK